MKEERKEEHGYHWIQVRGASLRRQTFKLKPKGQDVLLSPGRENFRQREWGWAQLSRNRKPLEGV